ncbi:MAG: hypothetical protein J5688_06205 [Paludibacteraceae bacterium]|nr:hypothetical protein [Paludibacteraceae bacterium]
MKRSLYILLALCCALSLYAEDESHRRMNPHMLRLAWGDQHFEHIGWHESPQPMNELPILYLEDYNEHFRYTQHWSLEYQYRVNRWFSYGGMVDGSGVMWDVVTRNGLGYEMYRDVNHCFYNIVAMPTIYFTYLHHEYVSLHSGLGVGLNVNGGTELDGDGRSTVCAPAVNLTLIGVSAWYRSWFASAELGAMLSLKDGQSIYLFGSRLFSVAIGVTF